MRILLLLIAALFAGCAAPDADPDGGPDPDGDDQLPSPPSSDRQECSDEVKEASKPTGIPFGTFDHSIRNEVGGMIGIRVQHLHGSGCVLGEQTAVLANEVTLTLEYEEHLFNTSKRIVHATSIDPIEVQPVDWMCSWDQVLTFDGLAPRDDAMMCA